VQISEIIRRRIRQSKGGVDVVADVNAAVAGSVDERGGSRASVSTRRRIVQRSGRTVSDVTITEKEERHDG